MHTPSDADLMRFIAGDCSSAEARRIDEWLSESSANETRAHALRAIWSVPRPIPAVDVDVDALWTRLRTRMESREARPVIDFAPRTENRLWAFATRYRRAAAIAAAFLVAIASGSAIRQIQRDARVSLRKAPAAREYFTGRGERATIQLSDGSHITLAPLTRVRILPGFGVRTRELVVDGEAILDVVHDESRPFRVHAGSAVAEDIGTRFVIRAYAGDSAVTVAVAEGAVSLGRTRDTTVAAFSQSAEGVVVRAGEFGQLGGGGQVTMRHEVHLADRFGWASGSLSFDDTSLDEVSRTLERWYDVKVVVGDSTMRARRLTGRFQGQSPHEILGAIAITLDAELEWRGGMVTISPRR
jgi:ferric-dicitrate binding protein FerR (iron transport regulator)